MSHEWQEVPIEDVQPGDVARCNGREFPVDHHSGFIGLVMDGAVKGVAPGVAVGLGVTFWRKVKREPRSGVATVLGYKNQGDGDRNWIDVPLEVPQGTTLRWTEILDGEDGS